jgi:hypothetical protein
MIVLKKKENNLFLKTVLTSAVVVNINLNKKNIIDFVDQHLPTYWLLPW